jgi:hypothetical protein
LRNYIAMNLLINDLRLKLAQLNSFLIQNYLLKIKKNEAYPEHQKFLFDAFHNLSEGLAALGVALEANETLSAEHTVPLQKALADATLVTYLIERSTDIDDLTETIKSILSDSLDNTVEHIKAYGLQFPKSQDEINEEISALIAENPDYFNEDGTLKYSVFRISTEDASAYLLEHATVSQVKNAFKNSAKVSSFFNSFQVSPAANGITTLMNLLTTLTIILVAFGYVEPFFEKDDLTVYEFHKLVKAVAAMQSSLLTEL